MDAKALILEIFRETDFINESVDWDDGSTGQARQSIAAIHKACSASNK